MTVDLRVRDLLSRGPHRQRSLTHLIEQRAILDEFLNAGFAPRAMQDTGTFYFPLPFYTAGSLGTIDPTYEDDFWSKPGYEGSNPPSFLSAAKVDGFATITAVDRDGQSAPVSISFDPETVPKMGSMGSDGLQFYVYTADEKTRTVGSSGGSLSGDLKGATLTLKEPNDPAMLKALTVGGKIRINNRFLLALCFYPRHDIVTNGNPAYKQYLNTDGTPKYPQRSVPGWKLNSPHLKKENVKADQPAPPRYHSGESRRREFCKSFTNLPEKF